MICYLLLLVVQAATFSEGRPPCSRCIGVSRGEIQDARSCAANATLVQREDLQTALWLARDLALSGDRRNCVGVVIPAGHHVITSPVDFGNASVAFTGSAEATTVYCNYTVLVDNRRIFNYTLTFGGSGLVSFDSIEFVGCPYPLRLERIRTVAVHNSTFK